MMDVLLLTPYSMAGVTDIVDWTYNETGLNYDWTNPTSSTLSTMYDMSPIKHIGNIKAPVYLMIGKYNIWKLCDLLVKQELHF